MKTRDIAIDIVKGICILLVVWGHLPRTGSCYGELTKLVEFLYSFHVETFILLSGFLFANKTWSEENAKGIVTRLVKPYIVFAIIFQGLQAVLSGGCSLGAVLKSVMLGGGGGALWYVYDLAIIEAVVLVGWLITDKIGLKKGAVVLPLTLGAAVFLLFGEVGMGAGLKVVFLEYFVVGYLLRRFVGENLPRHPACLIVAIISALTIPYKLDQWGNLIFGVAMVGALLWIGDYLKTGKVGAALAYVGRNSFPILLIHPLIIGVMKPVYHLLLKFEPTGLTSMFVSFVVASSACLGADLILKKYNLRKYFY